MKQNYVPEELRTRRPFIGPQTRGFIIERIALAQTPWYEDEEAIRHGLEWGRKKVRLLRWVESQMMLQLTLTERRCIELYYFKGLNYRQCGQLLGVNASSVYRAVQRGIRKLKIAARKRPDLMR
jgi:DNA-directed RNA polymerase specialized sigma24 family protein